MHSQFHDSCLIVRLYFSMIELLERTKMSTDTSVCAQWAWLRMDRLRNVIELRAMEDFGDDARTG